MCSNASPGGCVLIVDDSDVFRDSMRWQLNQIGCEALVSASYGHALELLKENSNISVVVLDHLTISGDMASVVRDFKAARSNVLIVGNSGGDRKAEFASVGVDQYLQKPWRAAELLAFARRKLGNCVECGIELPLRHPGPNEIGRSWTCAFCGARYNAIMDESAPSGTHSNVSPVD